MIHKRGLMLLLSLLLVLSAAGCGAAKPPETADTDCLQVVTTIFPPYDFVRAIAGDTDISLTMLLKPGMESHSYEPSPSDILAIQESDIFIYNGGESDVWIDHILDALDTQHTHCLRMMDCVEVLEEEGVNGEHTHEHEHTDEEAYDEHIWTSPRNAVQIVRAISELMIQLSPENAAHYRSSTEDYILELNRLNDALREVTETAERNTLIFGDRFPFRYLADAYHLEYGAAFPGCSSESEPSAETVASLIDRVKQEGVPYVLYLEFSTHKIADTIAEETGAKTAMLHSCHNVSRSEMESGATYLNLMYANCEVLREALN